MRKVTYVILFLIALDICAIFKFAEATESATTSNVNDKQHRSDSAEEYIEDEYASQESDISGRPIGRWRSTGEALEPKWRDGDSVPLVPFYTATVPSKSSVDKEQDFDKIDDDKSYASNRRSTLWKTHSQEKSTVITDEYDFNKDGKPERKNDYQGFRSREIRLSRRRKPPQFEDEDRYQSTEKSSSKTEDLQEDRNHDGNKVEIRFPKLSNDNNEYLEGVALRYRETFQNHPNEYELNDEEYQRPRPRKRRPPQNYEFTEVKTSPVSLNDRSNSLPIHPTLRPQKKQESTRRNNLSRIDHNKTIQTFDSDKQSENSELKSLLKMQQVEGSSLSEILQRRNLTLSDLLQGKADVINLLKSSHTEDESEEELHARAKAIEMMKISASSTFSISSTSERAPWIPSQIVLAKSFEKQDDDPFSNFRAASTHAYQKVLPTQDEHQKVHPTESMKLLVSSEIPITITTIDSVIPEEKDKVKIIYDEDEIMEFSDFTVLNSKSSTEGNNSEGKTILKIDDLNKDSESTLSIEHILSPTKQPFNYESESKENIDKFSKKSEEKIQFENKIPHSEHENDNVSSTEVDSFELEYQNDEEPRDSTHNFKENKEIPIKSSINNSSTNKEFSLNDSVTSEEHSFKNHKKILNHKNYEIYSEMEPDARAEILELFNSGSSAKKLEGLLKTRNMSIEDLIALRQRGSSQLHLAEAAQSRDNSFKLSTTKDPEQSQDSQDKNEKTMNVKIIKPDCTPSPEVKEIIEWIKDKESKKEPVKEILHIKEFETLPPIWSNQFAPNEENQQTEEENHPETKTRINSESRDQSDNFINILSHFESSQPFDNQKSSEGISFYTSNIVESSSNLPERRNNSVIPIEDGRVQEIGNDISKTFNSIYRLNAEEGNNGERYSISRVRPSIIASGAILGVTIVVFLGIFITCRIRQKQKYTYRNTFSRAVFQSPVLTARKLSNTSSLNTIMVNVVATSTTKRPEKSGSPEIDDDYDVKSDIENDSLDANDSWETIPDFMK